MPSLEGWKEYFSSGGVGEVANIHHGWAGVSNQVALGYT